MMTDRELQQRLLAALEDEPGIKADGIGVTANDGVVTLRGTVTTLTQKRLAESTAHHFPLVRSVANHIVVVPDAASARTDSAIAGAAAHALEWDSDVPDKAVTATVRNGWVALSGTVSNGYQRTAAEEAVSRLRGVKGVSSSVTIKPTFSISDVRAVIEQAFRRTAVSDAQSIRVDANDGTIVLSGAVHSLHEHDDAERAAQGAPGITHVDNHLVVKP
jgi:osmotically-inducible protein OsmY